MFAGPGCQSTPCRPEKIVHMEHNEEMACNLCLALSVGEPKPRQRPSMTNRSDLASAAFALRQGKGLFLNIRADKFVSLLL
eukprot:3887887-Alexandrium_andersonii.AAC.1